MQHNRANRRIACHLLGGIYQPFEHRLVERIVFVRAHHGDRCNAIGTNPHTNSVFAHAWQSTATRTGTLFSPTSTKLSPIPGVVAPIYGVATRAGAREGTPEPL